MSNQFQLGHTYKMSEFVALGLKLVVQAVFNGDDGVFTVHELTDDAIFTDDITSPILTSRCRIPNNIFKDCEEIVDAS